MFRVLPYNRVEAEFFAWSPDASKIAYPSSGEHDSNLWIVSADGSSEMALANNSEPFLSSPLWLRDNSGVAYLAKAKRNAANGKLVWSIWLADLKSNKPVSIFESNSALRLLGWSEHGDELLVGTIESQGLSAKAPDVRLFFVSKSGRRRDVSILKSAYLDNIRLSPDGRTIAFASDLESHDNIWIIPAEGGRPRKVTSNADPRLYFSSMAFSPDGKTIYFGKQSRSSVTSMIDNFR